jgi:hypothetical protein
MCTVPLSTAGKRSYVLRTTKHPHRTGRKYSHENQKYPTDDNRRGTRNGGRNFRKVGGSNETCLSQSCSNKSPEQGQTTNKRSCNSIRRRAIEGKEARTTRGIMGDSHP